MSDKRRAHVERVTTLLVQWTESLQLPAVEATAWRDAGAWHDALRDAPLETLREWAGPHAALPEHVLHGPAAAARFEAAGESRGDVLEAIRWHTLGDPAWGRTGRALYMADFLEPGRPFAQRERAWLAARVASDFDGIFRQVVRLRLEWTIREGKTLFPRTVELWNAVR